VNFKRALRSERAQFGACLGFALGVVIAFVSAWAWVGIGLAVTASLLLLGMYHESESAFWRSQFEWWDDDEWDAWQRGES
jgi:hypothetical protein